MHWLTYTEESRVGCGHLVCTCWWMQAAALVHWLTYTRCGEWGGRSGVGKESPVFHCAIFSPKVLKRLWETLHLPESSNADFFCKIRMRQHEQHPKHWAVMANAHLYTKAQCRSLNFPFGPNNHQPCLPWNLTLLGTPQRCRLEVSVLMVHPHWDNVSQFFAL